MTNSWVPLNGNISDLLGVNFLLSNRTILACVWSTGPIVSDALLSLHHSVTRVRYVRVVGFISEHACRMELPTRTSPPGSTTWTLWWLSVIPLMYVPPPCPYRPRALKKQCLTVKNSLCLNNLFDQIYLSVRSMATPALQSPESLQASTLVDGCGKQ